MKSARSTKPPKATKLQKNAEGLVLLSGGNPQIAKADGDAPVQAYIAAMPGWKSDLGRRLDALIVQNVPHVTKAVRWNSPFYGVEGQGWFLSFHVLTRYVKVTFFAGMSLQPIPPGGTEKSQEARWIDIYEDVLINGWNSPSMSAMPLPRNARLRSSAPPVVTWLRCRSRARGARASRRDSVETRRQRSRRSPPRATKRLRWCKK
ncbi:hypothetical protein BH20VER1_BH20VER1_08190 [soil metagenome]